MQQPTLEDFLQRALVWPDPNSDTGWINLHWRLHDRKGITGGQAFKRCDEVRDFIYWSQKRGKGKVTDIYFCTSLQAQHGNPKPNGRYSALRSADNAISSKLLFADVDKYDSKLESFAAIKTFCEVSRSPFPTALVDSGGGVHAYWILPQPLPPDEWLEYAHRLEGLMNEHGLKHDNITTDVARILRPPGTLNYKHMEKGIAPRPVVLKLLNGDVDIQSWRSLLDAVPTVRLPRNTGGSASVTVEHLFLDPTAIQRGPSRFFDGKIPLAEQIGEGSLDPTPILQLCPMFAEALATGGEKVSQPVWHQQALACTFITKGQELFHKLGSNHVGYSREATDDMYNRKIRDRASKGLGYPSCAAFKTDGAPQCSTCLFRDKVKSPLNIDYTMLQNAQRQIVVDDETPKLKPVGAPPPGPEVSLSEGFSYDWNEGGVIKVWEGAGQNRRQRTVIGSRINSWEPQYGFGAGRALGLTLKFQRVEPGSREETVWIPPAAFRDGTGKDVYSILDDAGCVVRGSHKEIYTVINDHRFSLTFRGRMHQESEITRNIPQGWEYAESETSTDHSQPIGFSFAGEVYGVGGKTRKAFIEDDETKITFAVTGKSDAWVDALRILLGMKSPGLQVVALSAFAAPLMIFTGQPSTVVMVRGQSGGSKSTATAIACAAWACPRDAMLKPSSSKLAVMKFMGEVRNIPVYWDDLRNDHFEYVKDTLMEITQGGEGRKLDQNRNQRKAGKWDSMLLTSSNSSLVEYLEEANKNDGAALVRCFEFEVPKILAQDAAYVDPTKLSATISALDYNHGHAGREYARLLGYDPVGLRHKYERTWQEFAGLVAPYQPHERYWMATAVTILMGAYLANQLPCLIENNLRFDIPAVMNFLRLTYLQLRARHASAHIHSDAASYVKHWLGEFINGRAATDNQIAWTQDVPLGPGKPVMTSPIWPLGDAARNQKTLAIRWITSSKKVRISKSALGRYLRHEKISVDRMDEGLLKYYGAKLIRGRMAAGLTNIPAQAVEWIYEVAVTPGSWLDECLQVHATADDIQKISPQPRAQTPDR
jgi:hypothetical protein